MSKKDYIDAVNEINISEELKNKTLANAIQKLDDTKPKYNRMYPIASFALMCVVLIALVLPNKNIVQIKAAKDKVENTNQQLPKIKNFNNLYAMLKSNSSDICIMSENTGADSTMTTEKSSTEPKSNTKKQIECIHETNITKTDGKNMYHLTDEKVEIINTQNKSSMKQVGSITLDENFEPREMFLTDENIIVIGIRREKREENLEDVYTIKRKIYISAQVYNIKDKSNPILERTVEIEGNYLNTKMIGENIYLISNKYMNYAYICNIYQISELNENIFKPEYLDTAKNNQIQNVDYDCIYYIPESKNTNYLNILKFNIKNHEETKIQCYLGAEEEMYMNIIQKIENGE